MRSTGTVCVATSRARWNRGERFVNAPTVDRKVPRELLILLAFALPAVADSYSPDAERDYPTNLYWGDMHVHTS